MKFFIDQPNIWNIVFFLIQPQHLLEQLGGSVFFKVFPLEAVGFKDLLPRDILHDKICTHVTSHMASVYNRSQ